MQVEQFLEQSADRSPEKIALIAEGKKYSYGELDRICNRLAHLLVAEGIQRGDRVAIFLENSAETVISIYAILKVGAVFLVVNPGTKADKLAYILNNCRAAALVSHAKQAELLHSIEEQATSLRFLILIAGESAARAGREWRRHSSGRSP